jgi:hypothetical protein
MSNNFKCPDCGVVKGELHECGCDVERCPECGGQLLSCGHTVKDSDRMPWTGRWPGVDECEEYGLYAYYSSDAGWVKCGKNDPGAGPDLNALPEVCSWDKNLKKWTK